MTPFNKYSIALAVVAAIAIFGFLYIERKVHTVPDFAILYCDTTTFNQLVNVLQPLLPADTSSPSPIPAISADYGSLFFKYYLAPDNLNLHAWSFKPFRGNNLPDFDPQPDLRLTIGRNQPDVKFHTGDYVGDFILNKSSMLLVQNAYRASPKPFILFYPERRKDQPGVSWRIVLANFAPLRNAAKYVGNDTTGGIGEVSSQIYLNPIPPKGINSRN